MEQSDGKSFNCAESVIMRANRNAPLPDFNPSCMRVASALGGGIAGTGEICGALSGGIMCFALLLGTNGDEPLELFKEKRTRMREFVTRLMHDFVDSWGNVRCKHLLAMDKGQEPARGSLRFDSPRKLCGEYVNWVVKRVAELQGTSSDK